MRPRTPGERSSFLIFCAFTDVACLVSDFSALRIEECDLERKCNADPRATTFTLKSPSEDPQRTGTASLAGCQ
ncbi:hypothetical protein PF004_g27132 [Phytophthora fragariae]|uniref:Secreted protein n=1 Tax=Phytophthora fragariae TaxID=53985 RepID=A0A6G0MLP9_9STRA|nr:hypothetical protein PF004_g27132 [Phytophthora fragariae]